MSVQPTMSFGDILWPCVQEQPSILSQKLHLSTCTTQHNKRQLEEEEDPLS